MVIGMGTALKIGANSIVELKSIGGLELSADSVESTTLDSGGWRTFVQGLKDGGEVTGSGYFNPSDTNGQKAVYDAFVAGTQLAFSILFPASLGAEWTFNGIVTAVSTSAEMEDGVPFEMTIKVTGQPSLGLTASAGLSALALTGTGGTISPAFANNKYYYTFGGMSATSFTVTPTAASHTIRLYVDGVFVQNVVSATASASISIPTIATSKKVTLLVNETGKTTIMYEIVAVKTS